MFSREFCELFSQNNSRNLFLKYTWSRYNPATKGNSSLKSIVIFVIVFSSLMDCRNFMVFFGPLPVAGRVLWNRVNPPFHPPVLPSFRLSVHFLGIVSLVFSKFWHGAKNPYEVVFDSLTFRRKDFGSSIGKMDQKWAKNKVFWMC